MSIIGAVISSLMILLNVGLYFSRKRRDKSRIEVIILWFIILFGDLTMLID